MYQANNYSLQGCGPTKIFQGALGLPSILAGVPRRPSWSPKLINQWAVSWLLKIKQVIF